MSCQRTGSSMIRRSEAGHGCRFQTGMVVAVLIRVSQLLTVLHIIPVGVDWYSWQIPIYSEKQPSP